MKVRFLTVGTRGHSRPALRSLRSLRAVRSFCQPSLRAVRSFCQPSAGRLDGERVDLWHPGYSQPGQNSSLSLAWLYLSCPSLLSQIDHRKPVTVSVAASSNNRTNLKLTLETAEFFKRTTRRMFLALFSASTQKVLRPPRLVCMYVCICLFICLFVYLFICLFSYLVIWLFSYLYFYLFSIASDSARLCSA